MAVLAEDLQSLNIVSVIGLEKKKQSKSEYLDIKLV
jgi:hypothetical protein